MEHYLDRMYLFLHSNSSPKIKKLKDIILQNNWLNLKKDSAQIMNDELENLLLSDLNTDISKESSLSQGDDAIEFYLKNMSGKGFLPNEK